MLIGKSYIPKDNSSIINLATKQWADLFNSKTTIISEPYTLKRKEIEDVLLFGDENDERTFVDVTRLGETFRVMYHPGWVQEEDNTNVIIIVKEYKK